MRTDLGLVPNEFRSSENISTGRAFLEKSGNQIHNLKEINENTYGVKENSLLGKSRVELKDIININNSIKKKLHSQKSNSKSVSITEEKCRFENLSMNSNCQDKDKESISSSNLSQEESIKDQQDSCSYINYSFTKFSLEKRETPNYLCTSDKVTHKYLPLRLKNNSKYKKRLFKYLRRDLTHKSKNESCSYMKMMKDSFRTAGNFRKLRGLNDDEGKKIQSCVLKKTKSYVKDFEVQDYCTGEAVKFNLYQDNLIGLSEEWQNQLKITEMDDDIVTDDDQLEAATRHIRKEARESVFLVKESLTKIRNLTRYRKMDLSNQPSVLIKKS